MTQSRDRRKLRQMHRHRHMHKRMHMHTRNPYGNRSLDEDDGDDHDDNHGAILSDRCCNRPPGTTMHRWAGVALGTAVVEASNIWVVDVCGKSLGDQVAVQTCSGLFNRYETGADASFVLGLTSAAHWLADLESTSTKTELSVSDYMTMCLTRGVAKGYIKYSVLRGKPCHR